MIILSLFELLYLLSLHAGIFGSKYGPTYGNGYGNNAAGTGVGGPKAGNYGTPAASAVWNTELVSSTSELVWSEHPDLVTHVYIIICS